MFASICKSGVMRLQREIKNALGYQNNLSGSKILLENCEVHLVQLDELIRKI